MKYTFGLFALTAALAGVVASPLKSEANTFPSTPSKVTVWPEHKNTGTTRKGPAKSPNGVANFGWHVSIQIEALGWPEANGHFLQVEGDQNLGINWLTLGPTWRGMEFQWYPRDQTGSGVSVVGNIQHPALWGLAPVWGGFLKNELASGVSPLPVFMSAEGGPQDIWWFEDLALTSGGYLVRAVNGVGIEQGYENWLMCWTTYPVDQSKFLGLHWNTNGRYDATRCGPVRLRMTF